VPIYWKRTRCPIVKLTKKNKTRINAVPNPFYLKTRTIVTHLKIHKKNQTAKAGERHRKRINRTELTGYFLRRKSAAYRIKHYLIRFAASP